MYGRRKPILPGKNEPIEYSNQKHISVAQREYIEQLAESLGYKNYMVHVVDILKVPVDDISMIGMKDAHMVIEVFKRRRTSMRKQ